MVQWYNIPDITLSNTIVLLIKIKEMKSWKIKRTEIINIYTTFTQQRDD